MDPLKRLLEIQKRKAELRNSLNSLAGEELDKAIAEVDALKTEEDDINKRLKLAEDVEKRGNAIITPAEKEKNTEERQFTPENVISSPEYRSGYLKHLQGKSLDDAEKRALTTATSSVGAVIPTQTMNKIVEHALVFDEITYSGRKVRNTDMLVFTAFTYFEVVFNTLRITILGL